MLTPPLETQSFYHLHVKNQPAQALSQLLLGESGKNAASLVLVSKSFSSEIEALHELQSALTPLVTEANQLQLKFNPIYLPNESETIMDTAEFDASGEMISTGGFTDPFIFIKLSAIENEQELVSAYVHFHEFELPSLNKVLSTKALLS